MSIKAGVQGAYRWLLPTRPAPLYDRSLILLALTLMAVGLIMVASASIPEGIALRDDPFLFVKKHFIFLMVCMVVAAVALRIPMRFWHDYGGPLLLLAILALIAVLLIGRTVNGSTRWISLGPVNAQPAEFAKLALFIYLAGYLVRRQQEVQETLKGFAKPLLVLFLLALLLLLQPDLGSVVVMFATAFGMLFIGGTRLMQFFGIMLAGICAVVVLILVSPYRMRRITSFMDPWNDPFGSGYQLTQSLMAFGRGNWWGEGLGNSIQKLEYLPEAHTDFVFAVLAEEFGFIGVIVVLGLLWLLAMRALRIGRRALERDRCFDGYLACGIAVWFSFQTVVNVGAASGMLPTKGLTLPLVSYGGSSLIIMTIAVAILVRIDHEIRMSQLQAREKRA